MYHLTVNNYGIFIRRVKQRRLEPADELPFPHTPRLALTVTNVPFLTFT
jgi:hypothetical protein